MSIHGMPSLRHTGRRTGNGLRITAVALAGLLALGALSACSGGGDESASTSGSSAQDFSAAGGDAGRAGPEQGAPDRAVGAVSPESARASAGQKLVRRAHLQLKVESMPDAASRIRSVAAEQSGVVASEELYSGTGRDTSGTITISVPAGKLDATITLIEKVGDVQFRTSSSEDVTGTYVDTEARVKSMTASVARIRDLLSRASSVNDLVALENELSRRQAELDALTAQLASLEDSVAMSPISVTLSTDDYEPVAAGGFLSGLRSGWKAFVTSAAVLATVVGAVLPFAVAIGLLVAPLLWWVRRRRAGATAFAPPVAPAGPDGPMPPPSAG